MSFESGRDHVYGPDGLMRPFTLAAWAVEVAPDYLPARQQFAEACEHDGVDLTWALEYAGKNREARALEHLVETDDAAGTARTQLAEFWQAKGDAEAAVGWYLKAARHAEANGQTEAAFTALSKASMLKAYKRVQRELLRVASLLGKAR